jgi:arylsulfatase A-like enzyme
LKQVTGLNQPKAPRLVIVTIEGLGTNLVGCYGGAIAPTKNWDRLASKSIVVDQFWADTLRPVDILHSIWSGTHYAARQLGAEPQAMDTPAVPVAKQQVAVMDKILLATDVLSVFEESETDAFGDLLYFEQDALIGPETEEMRASQLEQLFQAALGKWSAQLHQNPILWIHSSGLNGPWDAPYTYRQVMCDEGDPDPPVGRERAELQITEKTDPDEIFGHACCAGGQAIAMDEAWEMLEDAISELGIADDCMLILAGVGGYPMGEHGWVGNGLDSLFAETIHLPLIIRPGNRLDVGQRIPFIVQPHQLLETILRWLMPDSVPVDLDLTEIMDLPPAESWPIVHQVGFALYQEQMHLIAPAWSYRWMKTVEGTEVRQLYAMPDDRWQQNEISQRAVATVELMEDLRSRWLTYFQNPSTMTFHETTRLPQELTHPFR